MEKDRRYVMNNKPWVSTIRRESGLVELVCKCGIGHPAYGSVHWLGLHGKEAMDVHGCCGCCKTPEWQLADAREGAEIANGLVKRYLGYTRWYSARTMLLEQKILDMAGLNDLVPATPAEKPTSPEST